MQKPHDNCNRCNGNICWEFTRLNHKVERLGSENTELRYLVKERTWEMVLEEQSRIENGGLTPGKRLETMARLKAEGIFVSAAVAPLMPYGPDFGRKLLDSSTMLRYKCSTPQVPAQQHPRVYSGRFTMHSPITGNWKGSLPKRLMPRKGLTVSLGGLPTKVS